MDQVKVPTKINATVVFLILIASVITYFTYTHFPDQTLYNMSFEITPIFSEDNLLKVKLKVGISSKNNQNKIDFYTGDKNIAVIHCVDDKGNKIIFKEEQGILSIPTKDKSKIEILYYVKIGVLGKHGYRGKIYDDLVVFDGGQVLLFPIDFYNEDFDANQCEIGSIAIKCNVKESWEKVIPYERINKPTWFQLYALYNSCFAYGDLEKKEYKKGPAVFRIYRDVKCDSIPKEAEVGLNYLFDYYASLFEFVPDDYSIILLRRNQEDQQYIIGGAGAKTVGSTFEYTDLRDWQLMSHRMFHGFFETKVKSKKFFKPPQLWFYEGLATYYENKSMESLPYDLKTSLSLQIEDLFTKLYREYIYMRLKYHPLLTLTPMNEENIIAFPAKAEFLHYTQAPLVIKALEDLCANTNGSNTILKYIINNYNNDEMLSVKNIVFHCLKDERNFDFYNRYFLNDEILPLWYLSENKSNNEDLENVINDLNFIEYTVWSWLRVDFKDLPLYQVEKNDIYRLSKIKQIDNVHFADEDTEEKVKQLSSGVYYALKEFVLRSHICNVDYKNPISKIETLLTKENIDKWQAWISTHFEGE